MLKKTLFILYVIVLISMAVATFVEPARGTGYVAEHVYGSWWFIMLWALLAATAIIYFVKRRVKRASLVALHLSFIVILIGAILTHLFSEQGTIHLRIGETSHTYMVSDKGGGNVPQRLPFEMKLNSFDIVYHEGTTSVADYVSTFTINDDGETLQGQVSMNKIFSRRSIRIYQMSYDTDGQGARLSVNIDPWGIPVTYAGYALLFLSLLWMLIDPKGGFRRTLHEINARQKTLVVAAMLMLSIGAGAQDNHAAQAPHTLSEATARQFGKLYVMYNGRICPMQTLAIDFTKKLCGKASYRGYIAEQVLAGFLFWPQEWEKEPIIKLKGGQLRDRLQLPKYASEATFFNRNMGGYILGPYVAEYYKGNGDKFHTQVVDVDDRLQLVMDVHRGAVLEIFPYQDATHAMSWYSPIDDLPETMEPDRQLYIKGVMRVLYDEIHAGDDDAVDELIRKMRKYQRMYGGSSLPSPSAVKAERLYNAVPFATTLFIINLTFGLLALLWAISRTGNVGAPLRARSPKHEDSGNSRGRFQSRPHKPRDYMRGRDWNRSLLLIAHSFSSESREKGMTTLTNKTLHRLISAILYSVAGLSFLALTLCLTLRWIISGTVPMANGYETMLLTAWLVLLLTLITCWRFRIVLAFGMLLSGFFLLVSHIGQMDPQITHIMPVLSSPLLSVHVSLIMMSFALLSLTFITSLTAIATHLVARRTTTRVAPTTCTTHSAGEHARNSKLTIQNSQLLVALFLYPAIALLGAGIFVGAIWANMSWGTYWSWDPKEVWALITFMVYAVAVHSRSVPAIRRPMAFLVYIAIAFLTILMTYFGVNYVLGGMHSYA